MTFRSRVIFATVGVAAEREGGVSSASNDVRIRAFINDKWFKYNVETFRKLNLTVDEGRVLITGIVQNPGAIGAAAVRLVIDKLNRNDRGVPALRQTILMPGHWHEGRTLGPLTRDV